MGAVRDYFDVVGGVRSGLSDDPPWWAPGAIAIFGVLVVVVLAASLILGVDGSGSAESARLRAAPASLGAGPGPVATTAPATEGATEGAAGGDTEGAAGAASGDGDGDGGTVALADRSGTFQQVPRAAVAAARGAGAERLGLPADSVRHQLVTASATAVELTVASLDGRQVVTVTAVAGDGGSWQVP
jgi:hypothetical protein